MVISQVSQFSSVKTITAGIILKGIQTAKLHIHMLTELKLRISKQLKIGNYDSSISY
jgi:hypothetical protein